MLRKKIVSLLLSASFLTPAATAALEGFDPECIEAATNFIPTDSLYSDPWDGPCVYAMPPVRGDVNGDLRVTISDYTLLKRYLNSNGDPSLHIDKESSDLNNDGKIDSLDLLELKSLI